MPAPHRQPALGRSAGAAAGTAVAVGVAAPGSRRWAAAGGEGWSGTVVDHAACDIGYQYDPALVGAASVAGPGVCSSSLLWLPPSPGQVGAAGGGPLARTSTGPGLACRAVRACVPPCSRSRSRAVAAGR